MSPATWVVGLVLLLIGRRAFWFFVAGAGFLAGTAFAASVLPGRPDALAVGVALGCGVLGGFLALFAQKVAVGVGGFLAGAYLGQTLGPWVSASIPAWAVMIGSGVLGAILLLLAFDPALRLLSALLGASVLAQALPLRPPWTSVIFVVLALAGFAFQSRRRRARGDSGKRRSAGHGHGRDTPG